MRVAAQALFYWLDINLPCYFVKRGVVIGGVICDKVTDAIANLKLSAWWLATLPQLLRQRELHTLVSVQEGQSLFEAARQDSAQ